MKLIQCRSVEIQKGIEEGLTHGGIQAQGVFFVGIQSQLLLLAAIKREMEEEHDERSKKGLFEVQVIWAFIIDCLTINVIRLAIFGATNNELFDCGIPPTDIINQITFQIRRWKIWRGL